MGSGIAVAAFGFELNHSVRLRYYVHQEILRSVVLVRSLFGWLVCLLISRPRRPGGATKCARRRIAGQRRGRRTRNMFAKRGGICYTQRRRQFQKCGVDTHGERAEREPITGVWGQSPQRGPGAEPLVRG